MLRGMGERLRTTAARHPGRALGLLAAAAVLCCALAAGWTERLTLSSSESKGPLQIQVRGGVPADSAASEVAVRTMQSQLEANPVVATVDERRGDQDASSTVLVVRFEVGGRKRDEAIAHIQHNLDPGSLTVAFRGPAAAARAAKDDALDALVLLLIALPVVGLIAAASLGIRPAGAALLAAAAASGVAALACELLAGAIDVSWLSLVGAAAGGTLLVLQLCAMAGGGATPAHLWGAGLAAALVFGASALLGVDYLASLGLGGGLAAALAIPASIAGMGGVSGLDARGRAGAVSAPWRGIAGIVGWSRLIGATMALLAVCLLLIAAAPVDHLASAALGSAVAPEITDVRLAGAVGASVVTCLVLGWVFGRRFGLPLLATAAAALPALAAAGLLVTAFQEGRYQSFLDYGSNGVLQLGSIVTVGSIVAALCASQAVALACAARQTPTREEPVDWVREALARCGPASAASCLAGVAAGVALGFASERFLKEFGLGVAAGLTLELLVVQFLVAPALLRLTYRRPRDQ
jgi:hypothetical protein